MRGVVVVVVVAWSATVAVSEGDFPPGPMPVRPAGFNIHCDVCDTLMRRVVPYCERDDANLDYLPDFCVFNYNKVLRRECDYLVDVMEFAMCPSACAEIRKLQSYASEKICHHHLVNCTERFPLPPPSPSPSPSPSAKLPYDCVLCEYILKQTALLCMNQETANKRNIYRLCMAKTMNREDFNHCTKYLNQLVDLAGTQDPCSMLSCENPRVACMLNTENTCNVDLYDGPPQEYTPLGLDKDGNFLDPSNTSLYSQTEGLGPSDFRPGESPHHSNQTIKRVPLPPNVRVAGHLITSTDPFAPVTPEEIAADDARKEREIEEAKQKAWEALEARKDLLTPTMQ